MKIKASFFFSILFLLILPSQLQAYSLLTHEAIIDVSWEKSIQPRLLSKFPDATKEQLLEAHSYAYGGAIMPDIGYSPFGSMVYTDFVHNVRSGDYVKALIEEAETLNEYAFALGSLAHYMADSYGHLLGTNVAVPLVYPEVGERFGPVVTYADHTKSHSRMELAFDVLQTARGNYANKDYHDFIGFQVATSVVEKAFYRTYGLGVKDVFGNINVAIGTYRWTIKTLLPTIVRTAWASKKSNLKKADPSLTARKFSYRMRNRTYYHEFGREHQKAGFFPTIISFILPIIPKIGPLAKMKFRTPTPEAEKLFIRSFDTTLVYYQSALKQLAEKNVAFKNLTLDTGHKTAYGTYSITDRNYGELVLMLGEEKFETANPEIVENIIAFYAGAQPPSSKKEFKKWNEVQTALEQLRKMSLTSAFNK